jgi:lysozyme family protein
MSDLKKSAQFVLENEDAGLTGKVTTDAGGTTKYGIAGRYNPPEEIARLLGQPVAIPDLTVAQAAEIYVAKYGQPFLLDRILDQDVADRCMDVLVNPGPGDGAILMQRAVNGYWPGLLAEDGKIGPQTITHINIISPGKYLAQLRTKRCLYYFNNCQANPDKLPFLGGWLVRACL